MPIHLVVEAERAGTRLGSGEHCNVIFMCYCVGLEYYIVQTNYNHISPLSKSSVVSNTVSITRLDTAINVTYLHHGTTHWLYIQSKFNKGIFPLSNKGKIIIRF